MNEVAQSSLLPSVIKNSHCSDAMELARAKLAQRVLGVDNIPLSRARVWDGQAVNLPATASSDDLGFYTGTFATDLPTIQAGDVKATSSTRRCGLQVAVPDDYEAGETFNIVLLAGMKTTVADGSCTIDVMCCRSTEDGLVAADICATAAQSINSLTAAEKSFTITPTTLVAGDILDVQISIAYVDAATATAVIPRLVSIKVKSDRR